MVPDFEAFLAPALQGLSEAAQTVDAVAESCAEALGLDAAARAEVISYDRTPVFVARTRMALQELAHAGLASRQEGGFVITEVGRGAEPPSSRLGLEQYSSYQAYRARHLARRGA